MKCHLDESQDLFYNAIDSGSEAGMTGMLQKTFLHQYLSYLFSIACFVDKSTCRYIFFVPRLLWHDDRNMFGDNFFRIMDSVLDH